MFNLVITGQTRYGTTVYNIDGNWIRKGQDPNGEILFSLH